MHRLLEFNQSQWLKQSIDFNTQKRIEPQKTKKMETDGKMLYKLMNNSHCIQKNHGKLEKWNRCKTRKQ